MGQILVRRIDDDLKRRLRERASRHGVSMEEEARTILQSELLKDTGPRMGMGSAIAALFRGIEGNEEPLPEIPDEPVRPARFDE
jgi:plasmid stability protein